MQNSMVIFTIFCFWPGFPFLPNLVQKIKIVSLSWNVLPRLIWICRILWWYSCFLFYTGNTIFYCLCGCAGIETWKLGSCHQHSFFILLQWVRSLIVFVHFLKHFFKNLRQTFYFTWISFLLESVSDQIFH